MPGDVVPARGYIVAGGKSARMTRDKALIPFRGVTLIEHALSTAQCVSPEARILCGARERYEEFGVPVVVDPVCGVGPLGGLYAALLAASVDGRHRIFWLAVDMPLVSSEFVSELVNGLDRGDVVMARTPRGPEPLCAAFRTEPALAAVRRALLEGRLKLTDALEGLLIHFQEGDPAALVNVNTYEDYDKLAGARSDYQRP